MEGEEQMAVDEEGLGEGAVKWSGETFFTNANYQAKKMSFLLFINRRAFCRVWGKDANLTVIIDRLVESSRFKRAIETVYNTLLPKGSSPFVYLRLVIPLLETLCLLYLINN